MELEQWREIFALFGLWLNSHKQITFIGKKVCNHTIKTENS